MEFGIFNKPKTKVNGRYCEPLTDLKPEGTEEEMAGRPPKRSSAGQTAERILELSELDEAMALRCYPGDEPKDERRREGFLEFLRALRPSTASPKTSTRAVHVYFYDEMLQALYEGWRELVSNHQIDRSDSMSKVVGKMVTEYARLAKLHREQLRNKIAHSTQQAENRTGPTPHIAHATGAGEEAGGESPPDTVSSLEAAPDSAE